MITRDILDHIGDAIYGIDDAWRFTFFNRAAEQFFGRDRREIIGRTIWDCFPAAENSELGDALRQTMRSREAIHVDLLSPSTGKWADIRMFPLDEAGLGVSWRDISATKKLEIGLQEAIKNQDMLFRELAHRVTNNFHEVAARVALQGKALQDPVARDMCEKMAASIRCMAVVHRRLYRSRAHIDEQDLGAYVRALCDDLASGLPADISLSAVTEPGPEVSVEVATTVGMMVAELVTNSRKYAWAPGEPGRMVVTMRRAEGVVEVELRDDGRGVPEGVDLRASAGFGLKLLDLQIRRLKGTFTHHNVDGGAVFLLRFPEPKRSDAALPAPTAEERSRAAARLAAQETAREEVARFTGLEDWLDALDGVAYLVTPGGEVVAVGRKGWATGMPGAGGPAPEAVVGRNLFEMIADAEARRAFQAIHRRVATLAASALIYEYRCDAPDLERLMKMSVSALSAPSDGVLGVLYQSTLLSAKDRVPLAFLGGRDERREPNLPFVTVCQFCADVTMTAWRGEWVKPSDYYRRGGHDPVRLRQGVCPSCERTRLAPLLGA